MTVNKTNVSLYPLSEKSPAVDACEVNGEHVGFISENRDWNKKEKPVSVTSFEGNNLGDFCCKKCAVLFLTEKVTGIPFYSAEEKGYRSLTPLDSFLLLSMLAIMAEKSPR